MLLWWQCGGSKDTVIVFILLLYGLQCVYSSGKDSVESLILLECRCCRPPLVIKVIFFKADSVFLYF